MFDYESPFRHDQSSFCTHRQNELSSRVCNTCAGEFCVYYVTVYIYSNSSQQVLAATPKHPCSKTEDFQQIDTVKFIKLLNNSVIKFSGLFNAMNKLCIGKS